MEINARCTLDEKGLRAMQGVVMFRGKDPRRVIRRHTILFAVCTVLMILCALILYEDRVMFILALVMAAVCPLTILLYHYAYYISPRRIYRKLKLADTENRYVFGETAVVISSCGREGYKAHETFPYALLHKVMETSEYFFLFIDKLRAYTVDKSEMTNTEIEAVRAALLATPDLTYKACNY